MLAENVKSSSPSISVALKTRDIFVSSWPFSVGTSTTFGASFTGRTVTSKYDDAV